MELYPLKVFLTVATERSFSRAGEKLLRTQPAISIAIQRLESDLKEKLIDRSGRELLFTDAGRVVLEFAKRFQNLESELENSLRELKDNYAGRLAIGANETAALYLIQHIEQYRRLFPKVKVQVRRSESSKIPSQLLDGELELAVLSYDPADDHLLTQVIYTDRLALVVSPKHRFADRTDISIAELDMETFIAHNVISPYREAVLREFQRQKVPLNMDVEMPTVETIRRLVQDNEGVSFLPRMCVEQEIKTDLLREIRVKELNIERKIRLVYPARRRAEPRRESVSRCRAARQCGRGCGPGNGVSIAVAGGGIIGLTVAWRLAQHGFPVTVFDKGSMGGEASWAGAGMLAPGGEIVATSPIARLALEARRLYPSFVRELEETSATRIDFQECGALDLAYSAEDWRGLEARAVQPGGARHPLRSARARPCTFYLPAHSSGRARRCAILSGRRHR